jgi:hypothetical protein
MPIRTPADFGMTTPDGDDLISDGDEAITNNANKTAEWLGKLLDGVVQPVAIPASADLNSYRTTGWYYVRLTADAATITNRPPGIGDGPFVLRVVTTAYNYTAHTFYGYSGTAAGVYERNTSNAAGDNFMAWARLDNLPDQDLRAGMHYLREQAFRDRLGPVLTGGLGAVALRFDHGLANFNTKIRPLLEARGLPYSLALNSRSWGLSENAGVTAAMVDGWVAGGLAEVWNHGADHADHVGAASLDDAIRNGLAELRTQLPSAKIDGWVVPGVGGTNYDGFGVGDTPDAFADTVAGRIIQRYHAVSTGYISNTQLRTMDGRIRQGMGHFTIDSVTLASAQFQIDAAVTYRKGLQLMMHPSLVDGAGQMSLATLTQVLDYIVTKRDAGQLVVLSPYHLMVADNGEASARVTIDNTVGRRAFAWDAGNSRKQQIYGDTGLRDITAIGGVDGAGGNVYLSRTGNTVQLHMYGRTLTAAANTLTLPTGFWPDQSSLWGNPFYPSNAGNRILISSVTGIVQSFGQSTGAASYFRLSWRTGQPWPTSLPGTAVGAVIP